MNHRTGGADRVRPPTDKLVFIAGSLIVVQWNCEKACFVPENLVLDTKNTSLSYFKEQILAKILTYKRFLNGAKLAPF